jgi:CHRD domain-containing protein
MTLFRKAASTFAVLALVACASMAAKHVNVTLSGAEEVPPVSTAARGSGSFTIGDDGAVSGSVTTSGVQGTMAHIHMAAKGQNGGVIVPLTKSGDTYSAPAGAKLNEAQMAAFKAGNLYVNVHSAANKGGEIRGQLNP